MPYLPYLLPYLENLQVTESKGRALPALLALPSFAIKDGEKESHKQTAETPINIDRNKTGIRNFTP